jgi:hypothetical protein
MYEVIVGNIGRVFKGSHYPDAIQTFKDYKQQSKENLGRAAGEPVTLLEDGEPINEYEGTLQHD